MLMERHGTMARVVGLFHSSVSLLKHPSFGIKLAEFDLMKSVVQFRLRRSSVILSFRSRPELCLLVAGF